MSFKTLRNLGLVAAMSALSGCALTQMTDEAFLGNSMCPPRHADKAWAFALAAPPAMAADIITAPIQAVWLAAAGDNSLYRPHECMEESEHQAMINANYGH